MADSINECAWTRFGRTEWEENCENHVHEYRCRFCHMDTASFFGYYDMEENTPCPGSMGYENDGEATTSMIECLLNQIHRGKEV